MNKRWAKEILSCKKNAGYNTAVLLIEQLTLFTRQFSQAGLGIASTSCQRVTVAGFV